MIPPGTQQKLNGNHPEGTRHQAKVELALELIGNGISPAATIAELKAKFPKSYPGECEQAVQWAQARNPQPSVPLNGSKKHPARIHHSESVNEEPEFTVMQIVDGLETTEEVWREASPVKIPEDPASHAALLIEHLYADGEYLCGHWGYFLKEDGKAAPKGGGFITSKEKWLSGIKAKGAPKSEAGCWWRMNPVKEKGSGKDGAPTDADVTSCRFVLVEHDKLPLTDQLSLLQRFFGYGLPIVAVIMTGGKSVHAWVKLDASSDKEFRQEVEKLLSVTEQLGFDHNRNPSRLARIPGVKRVIGASGDGWQRLIYLNPNPVAWDFQKFADRFPVRGLISGESLIERAREWMRPKKPDFTLNFLRGDGRESGFYFRPGELTVWSGVTGHGKSSLIAQTIVEITCVGHVTFIASLEHRAEQICELFSRIVQGRPPTAEELEKFLKRMGNKFWFADSVGEISKEDLLKLMSAAYKRYGANHFFIDSLMRVSNLEEDYPAQLQFVNELQSFAKETNGHIHLVAHPRKMDETTRVKKMDLKGSSAIPNNADNVLCIRRNVQKQEADEKGRPLSGGMGCRGCHRETTGHRLAGCG